jgi:glycosyltransferase involved in cell wall biosynthesis
VRVAAFTGGQAVPSARFRVRQYIPALSELGVDVTEFGHGGGGVYPPSQRWRTPLWGATRLSALAADVIRARAFDCTLLQREMVSSFLTLEPLTKSPRILDVDDAVHLHRGGGFARRIAALSNRVIAGNSFLAEWYGQWNRDVVILPTGVDSTRYTPNLRAKADSVVIGWIGTASNHVYLDVIEQALALTLEKHAEAHLLIISDRPPQFTTLSPDRWSFKKWSEKDEISDIQSLDIGIMPLINTEIARGKCSFKMLQYMSCGLPVVASPVGMNAQVLSEGAFGHSATTTDEWLGALGELIEHADRRNKLGREGRKLVEKSYSIKILAPKLATYLA